MSETVTLDSATVDAIARRVAELIVPAAPRCSMTASEVAERFNVGRDWVYENADRLGAQRLSDGPKARLRFDPEKVADAIAPRPFPAPEESSRRRPNHRPSAVELLPIGRPK